jgi:hypothetical protein
MLISQTGRKSKNVFVIRALDVRLVSAPARADVPWSKTSSMEWISLLQ